MRHLADLAARSYEGAKSWPDRLTVFHRAVQLLDPVVRGVLAEVDAMVASDPRDLAGLDGTLPIVIV